VNVFNVQFCPQSSSLILALCAFRIRSIYYLSSRDRVLAFEVLCACFVIFLSFYFWCRKRNVLKAVCDDDVTILMMMMMMTLLINNVRKKAPVCFSYRENLDVGSRQPRRRGIRL